MSRDLSKEILKLNKETSELKKENQLSDQLLNEYKSIIKQLHINLKLEKSENKITVKKFLKSKKHLAIWCKSEDQAKKVLCAFNKLGARWADGDSYTDDSHWGIYSEDTCYYNDGTFGPISAMPADVDFYYFNEVDLQLLPKDFCTEEEKEFLKVILASSNVKDKFIIRKLSGDIAFCDVNYDGTFYLPAIDKEPIMMRNYQGWFKTLEFEHLYRISELIQD